MAWMVVWSAFTLLMVASSVLAIALPVLVWSTVVAREVAEKEVSRSRLLWAGVVRLSVGVAGGAAALLYYLSPFGWCCRLGDGSALIAMAMFSVGCLASYTIARVVGVIVRRRSASRIAS
jgi:hypothetical protein